MTSESAWKAPLPELSAQDLAFKNEFEAAAAGLTPEEFASTSEGRAKGEDIGKRADAFENHTAGSISHDSAVVEEGSISESGENKTKFSEVTSLFWELTQYKFSFSNLFLVYKTINISF